MVLEACEKYIATETVREDSTDTVDGLDIKEPKRGKNMLLFDMARRVFGRFLTAVIDVNVQRRNSRCKILRLGKTQSGENRSSATVHYSHLQLCDRCVLVGL